MSFWPFIQIFLWLIIQFLTFIINIRLNFHFIAFVNILKFWNDILMKSDIIQISWFSDRQSILIWFLIRIRAYHRVRIIIFLLNIYIFCFTHYVTILIIQLDCLILYWFVWFYYLLYNRHNITWNFLSRFLLMIRCICIFNFIARKDWFLVLY